MAEMKKNPCETCGACCAHFRVTFPKTEITGEFCVPEAFTEPFEGAERVVMVGTNREKPRCAALNGKLGIDAVCVIYDHRPSPCRKFGIQWSHGQATISGRDLVHCNRARHNWKLSRLSRKRLTIVPPDYDEPPEVLDADGNPAAAPEGDSPLSA